MTKENSGVKVFCSLGKVSSGFTKPVTGGPSSYIWFFDADAATILDVFSPGGDKVYKENDHIEIRLKFSETVKLENIDIFNPPVLSLILDSSPDGATTAQYVGGGGSDELYFEYIVQDGDNTAFLNVKELVLNGADLKDFADNPAETFIRGGILEANNHIGIDTTKPVVVDIESALSGYYGAGDEIEIELVFSEPVTVTGSPELVFKVDGVNSALSNATMLPRSGLDNSKLIFSKTFAADENHIDLDILQIDLKGGSIKDLVGNDLDPSFADDLLSKNTSISVINLPKLDFIVKKLDGTTLNELDLFNDSQINLQVKSKNPLDPAIGAFKYKVVDDEVICSQDGGSYTEVTGDSVTINLPATTIKPMVICGLSGLATGFYGPSDYHYDSFKLIRKQTSPPLLIIEDFETSTVVDTITPSILNPFVGYFKYRFDTVASNIECKLDSGYTLVDTSLSGKQLTLTMTSEEEWRLCIFAADILGNWQSIDDRTELITTWSTSGAIASVPGGIDKLYNASNAPGSVSVPIQIEVNGSDGSYYYEIGPSASTDCNAYPYTNGPIDESIPVTSLVYGADEDYTLCLKGLDSRGLQVGVTEYRWTYDSTAPTITSFTTLSSNGFYSDGDTIAFHIEYSEDVILSLNQPKLSLTSEGAFDSLGKATYDKALTANSDLFNYQVTAGDNAINISVDSFDLNGAKLTDLAGNDLDLTLPAPIYPNTSQVSIDNVVAVNVIASDFVDGERTNVQSTDITVSGSDVVGFQYKLTSDPNDCSDELNYISQNALQLDLDMSSLKDGPATLCALGTVTSGFSKPAGNGASTLSWIQDLTPPASPITISGIPSETNSSSITVTITDTDIAEYRYLVGESSAVDCEDESQYSAETNFGTGDIVLNFTQYGMQDFCLIAADDLGNWQSLSAKTVHNISYKPLPPKILQIRSMNSNGYYDVGEKIDIYVEFDDVVNVSGSDLELELKSDSIGSQLQNADYESGSGSTTLKFIYIVKNGDNGADIDVEQVKLNSSTIADNYANNADLSIPPNTTLSTQNRCRYSTSYFFESKPCSARCCIWTK